MAGGIFSLWGGVEKW